MSGVMNPMWKAIGLNVKRMMFERIVVPSVSYGAETKGSKGEGKYEIRCNGNEIFMEYMWCNDYK